MHSKRIMHRDIKPQNVFIDDNGVLKLGDLGLGRFFSSKTYQTFSLVGTPYYMSPERVVEKGYNWKSDVWSLGCILYEMAELRQPFNVKGQSYLELARKIQSCDYEPFTQQVSDQLISLVDDIIQPDPESRPSIHDVCERAREMCEKLDGMQAVREHMKQ
eukprot:TRINITY_DN15267_c0_g1_i1.p1 TRINITY_DN15267_c0_g1~~TRINITY_DN15267_c0_g1_i1.p1  ORF type:complete len:160 (+),score=39.01 TRINITY_DN15267_c0_g1_i1:58-537(+)